MNKTIKSNSGKKIENSYDDNKSYIKRIKQYTNIEIKSQNSAKSFLKSIGIIDGNGKLTKNYK